MNTQAEPLREPRTEAGRQLLHWLRLEGWRAPGEYGPAAAICAIEDEADEARQRVVDAARSVVDAVEPIPLPTGNRVTPGVRYNDPSITELRAALDALVEGSAAKPAEPGLDAQSKALLIACEAKGITSPFDLDIALRAEGEPGLDYEAFRMERGWPTPNHMRTAAAALDTLTPARYGDVLRWFADLADASLAARLTPSPEEERP